MSSLTDRIGKPIILDFPNNAHDSSNNNNGFNPVD